MAHKKRTIKKIIQKTVIRTKPKSIPIGPVHLHLKIDNKITQQIQNEIDNKFQNKPKEFISLKQRAQDREKISIIVACMNRYENLKQCVENWMSYKDELYEIIILDYGSKIPLENSDIHRLSKNIKLYRTEADHWHLTRAYNIAAQQVTGDIILKMDADYIIKPGFFEHHKMSYNSFMYGGGGVGGLYGFLSVYKNNFFLVNGYNERLINYGHDDKDIFLRLQFTAGLCPVKVNKNLLYHIPHSYQSRIENQNTKESIRSSCRKNVESARNNPWLSTDSITQKNVAIRII